MPEKQIKKKNKGVTGNHRCSSMTLREMYFRHRWPINDEQPNIY